MSIGKKVSTFTKKFLPPDFRKLAKAGMIKFDEEGMKLTEVGRYSLLYIQLEQEGVMQKMTEIADERISEQEEDCKRLGR